jgi:hypothetical protein
MKKTFTLDDLILFAYNETGEEISAEIIEAFSEDKELLDEYNSIVEVQSALDLKHPGPSEQTISNILNYSRALNVFKLKPAVNTCFVVVN